MLRFLVLTLAAIGLIAPSWAQQERAEVGQLDCQVEGGGDFILDQSRALLCVFSPADMTFDEEQYYAEVRQMGLKISQPAQEAQTIAWAVFAPDLEAYEPGALAGLYTGVSAEDSIGLGEGKNALMHTEGRAFLLEPVSEGEGGGVNIATGITEMALRPVSR